MNSATLPDALADALGRVVADAKREWRRDIDRLASESRVIVAELRVEVVTLKAALRDAADQQAARVAEAIGAVRDGAPGKDADPGVVAEIAAKRVSAELTETIRADVAAIHADIGALGAGIDGKIDGKLDLALAALPVPKDGEPGVPGRDGEPGASIAPAEVERMVADQVAGAFATIPIPENGKDADPEELRAIIVAEIGGALKARPVPADGHTPTAEELASIVETAVSRAMATLPVPKDGADGKDADPADVADMIRAEVTEAVAALPPPKNGEPVDPADVERMVAAAVAALPPAERGDAGPPGKFIPPSPWARGIHYESAIVAHAGSTYCALRDTAEEPPHGDWALIAARGADAPVGEVYGLYDEGKQYRKFDLVAWNGSEWRAKHDDPGPLPGDGWAMSAKVGKPGRPGDPGGRGDPGPPGKPGPAGPVTREWVRDGYRAIPMLSDGTAGPALDVREFFELYHGESRD